MSLTKARLCTALLALSAWAAPALAADPLLTFVATPDPVHQGQGVDISVMVSNVSDLYGYNFSFSFDTSLLQAVSITEGSFLSSAGSTYFGAVDLDNTTGTINYAYGGLFGPVPGASGSGTLATIHFNAIGTGSSALSFVAADTVLVNSSIDPSNSTITPLLTNTTLTVAAPVPEPAHYLMLLAGLAGIAAWRRRQSAV
jgi:hypothetical protein